MYRVGVDLGGTKIAVGIIDQQHKIISSNTVPTNAHRGHSQVIADISNTIDSLLHQNNMTVDDCSMIGIGAPGICDVKKGIVVRSYSLAWENVPLVNEIGAHFHIPVRIDNDANCAALAEVIAGAAIGCKNMVLVTLGTGIGTGIVINGSIYSGLNGSGTEMGHAMLLLNGDICSCGRRGCWDAYASTTALIVQAKRAAAQRPESSLNHFVQLTGKDIFDAYEHGDVCAKTVIHEYCNYIAVGISNIVNILAPEMILIGGGISREGETLLEPIRAYIRENCFDKREEALPTIKVAIMGNDAGIIGAAAL